MDHLHVTPYSFETEITRVPFSDVFAERIRVYEELRATGITATLSDGDRDTGDGWNRLLRAIESADDFIPLQGQAK